MEEGKRVRRTAEQIAADIDAQIEQLTESIGGIEEKKADACAEFDRRIDAVREKSRSLRNARKRSSRRKSASPARKRPTRSRS